VEVWIKEPTSAVTDSENGGGTRNVALPGRISPSEDRRPPPLPPANDDDSDDTMLPASEIRLSSFTTA